MTQTSAISEAAMAVLKGATTGMINNALALAGVQGSVVGIRPTRGFEDTKIIVQNLFARRFGIYF